MSDDDDQGEERRGAPADVLAVDLRVAAWWVRPKPNGQLEPREVKAAVRRTLTEDHDEWDGDDGRHQDEHAPVQRRAQPGLGGDLNDMDALCG